jgi:hypothetical protein
VSLPITSEEVEQANFVQWLEIKGYKFTAIPNSTYTKSWKQKAKNHRMGLRAGFPDIVVIADNHFIAIEMKRTKGGNNGTPAQREWVKALAQAGIPAKICLGCEEAIAFVQSVIGGRQSV